MAECGHSTRSSMLWICSEYQVICSEYQVMSPATTFFKPINFSWSCWLFLLSRTAPISLSTLRPAQQATASCLHPRASQPHPANLHPLVSPRPHGNPRPQPASPHPPRCRPAVHPGPSLGTAATTVTWVPHQRSGSKWSWTPACTPWTLVSWCSSLRQQQPCPALTCHIRCQHPSTCHQGENWVTCPMIYNSSREYTTKYNLLTVRSFF